MGVLIKNANQLVSIFYLFYQRLELGIKLGVLYNSVYQLCPCAIEIYRHHLG